MKKIAYLAPEIPALSATFVYNEILALEKLGNSIATFSIHIPKSMAIDAELEKMRQTTVYLYDRSKTKSFFLFLRELFFSLSTIKILFVCLMDILIGVKGNSFSTEKRENVGFLKRLRESLKLLYHFYWGVILAALLKERKITHLHIHFAHVPTQIGMYASMITKIPFTFTSHANDIFERGFLLAKKVERSHLAITISEYNKDYLIRNGCDSEKIKIIRCGVDSSEIVNKVQSSPQSKEIRIGSLGRLVEKKGMDTLILAFQKLNRKNAKLIIGGDGPLGDSLKQLAANYPNLQIEFQGNISHDRVNEWIGSLDVFVLACKEDKNGDKDGIPVVLMEAMNMYVAVVSTDISAIGELIEHKKSGFLAIPNNSDNLKDCLESVLELSIEEKQKILQNAKQKIIKEFDLFVNTKRLEEYFQ